VLAEITAVPPPPAAEPCTRATSRLPGRLAVELVNALAALALAGT
jgi:hypothetical protein